MGYVKKKSAKQENRTAKEFGGKTQLASGALWTSKGDVKTPSFLIENKFTDSDNYKLELKTWIKIFKEAVKEDLRVPLMQIDVRDSQYVLCDWHYLYEKSLKDGIDYSYYKSTVTSQTFRIIEDMIPSGTILKIIFVNHNVTLGLILKEQFLEF